MERLELVVAELSDLATPGQVLSAVDRIGTALMRAQEAEQKLRYLMGKAMLYVQEKKLWKDRHTSFEAWQVDLADRLRLSPRTIKKCTMLARNLPERDPSTLAHIPMTSLELTARVARQLEPREIAGLLRTAEKASVIEFKQLVEERGLLGRAKRAGYVVLTLRVRPGVAKAVRAAIGEGDAGSWLTEAVQTLHKAA